MSNTLTNIRKSSGGHSGLGSYLFPQKVRPKVPESPNIKALTSRRIFTLRRSHSNYYHRLYTSSHYRFDPYSDPYHGKTGRHTLTSNKIYFSKSLELQHLAALGVTPRHTVISSIYQFESLLLRQKRTLSPNGDRVLLFLPVHTSKSSINVYQNKIVPQGQKIPCGTNLVHDQVFGRSVFTQYWGRPLLSEAFYPFFSPYFSMSSRYS